VSAAFVLAATAVSPIGPVTVNEDLHEQIAEDPERVLPSTDLLAAAVDLHGLWRVVPGERYGLAFPGLYHSGIWLDVYAEARPFEDVEANLRLSLVNPGSSYGIVDTAEVVPWPSVSWRPTWRLVHFGARFFDLGRQTLGAGLVVQDQEGSGLLTEARWRALRVRRYWFGTNTFNLEGDLWTLGGDLWTDTLGVWGFRTRRDYSDLGLSLYSAHPLSSGLTPLAEIAVRFGHLAGMVGLRYARDDGAWWAGGATVQGRFYDAGFADDLVGRMSHDYLAPEQELYDFVRADNLFVYSDGVVLAAGRAWAVVRPVPWVHMRADGEYARPWWDEPRDKPDDWLFWRFDAIACARAPDNICLDVFYSNRMTSAVYLPLEHPDDLNFPMLFIRSFLGIEGRGRF